MTFGAIRQHSSCRRAGWPPRIALISRCALSLFLLLISFVPSAALENKACGQLIDLEALRRIRTVCVDTSYLAAGEASDIKGFVASENQPGQLLKRLPWQFADPCSPSDVVIRVNFNQGKRRVVLTEKGKVGGATSAESFQRVNQVVLLVYGRASVRLLYRTEVEGSAKNRAASLKGLFSRLIKDMKIPAP